MKGNCALCGISIPKHEKWQEYVKVMKGWRTYKCIGKKIHTLYVCPSCVLFHCPKDGSIILPE